MESEKLQSQIVEKQRQLTDVSGEVEGLRQERAKIALWEKPDMKAIAVLDKQIATAEAVSRNVPEEIKLLKQRLEEALAKEAQVAKNVLLSQQKAAAGKMEMLSPKLVKALEVAHDLNLQLTTVADRYCALQKQTEQDVIVKPTCRGSVQMLRVLYETNKAELAGIQQPRSQGQPPYLYI